MDIIIAFCSMCEEPSVKFGYGFRLQGDYFGGPEGLHIAVPKLCRTHLEARIERGGAVRCSPHSDELIVFEEPWWSEGYSVEMALAA